MKAEHNRAFKEWAVSCAAMRDGRQILLIRKGGIREDGGVFRINDPEFFLLPTYEHQSANLLQTAYVSELDTIRSRPHDPNAITLDAYAVVDTIREARDEEQVARVSHEHIWNAEYVRQRFNFNPYDSLYLVLLRVYCLPQPYTLPMRHEYGGCKSWVTLANLLSTAGAAPAISDTNYQQRKATVLKALEAIPATT